MIKNISCNNVKEIMNTITDMIDEIISFISNTIVPCEQIYNKRNIIDRVQYINWEVYVRKH